MSTTVYVPLVNVTGLTDAGAVDMGDCHCGASRVGDVRWSGFNGLGQFGDCAILV